MTLNDTTEIDAACLALARATKWTSKPIDAREITSLAERYADVAKLQLSESLNIDSSLVARAVRYIERVHAIPPMGNDVHWFENMLQALIEVARPNAGLDEYSKPFLKDMSHGIAIANQD